MKYNTLEAYKIALKYLNKRYKELDDNASLIWELLLDTKNQSGDALNYFQSTMHIYAILLESDREVCIKFIDNIDFSREIDSKDRIALIEKYTSTIKNINSVLSTVEMISTTILNLTVISTDNN